MFENVILDTELLPLRKAASEGDLTAMCQLARHIIDGDRTQISTDMLEKLCGQIVQHKELEGDIERTRDLCKLVADAHYLLYEEGKISIEEVRNQMRQNLKELVFWTVQLPFDQWDMTEIKNCVDWLHIDETEPLETIN